jgi:hypothetical protein
VLALDPDNAQYYQIRGRLSYALWLNLPDEPEYDVWLYEGLDDINEAYERGLRDDTTSRFRTAILNALVPRAMTQGEDYLASGEYELALAEFSLVAENRPENVEVAFKAGLAALATGDREQAERWIQSGVEAAAEMENRVPLLTEAVADLEAFLANRPDVEAPSLHRRLATVLEEFRAQDPDIVFAEGLAALQEGQQQQAADSYRQGLALAADQAAFNATAMAVLTLQSQATEIAITDTLSLFQEAFPRLERAAADETMVEAAFKLGFIATALEDVSLAAEWYNEAVRRSAVNVNYPPLRASRADLRDLWALIGVNSNRLLAQMQDQLPDQLDQHPDVEENGLYWRFRAWFKYGLGLSAFRLEEGTVARRALQSAQADADRAYELNPGGNAFVQTYLTESAWGWYHVVRGDDRYQAEEFEAALADYEAAAELIEPVENGGARTDDTVAAFRAGLTSVRLADFERAADWYDEGVRLSQQYGEENLVALALNDLRELVAGQPGLAHQEEVEVLLDTLQEQVDEGGK